MITHLHLSSILLIKIFFCVCVTETTIKCRWKWDVYCSAERRQINPIKGLIIFLHPLFKDIFTGVRTICNMIYQSDLFKITSLSNCYYYDTLKRKFPQHFRNCFIMITFLTVHVGICLLKRNQPNLQKWVIN